MKNLNKYIVIPQLDVYYPQCNPQISLRIMHNYLNSKTQMLKENN